MALESADAPYGVARTSNVQVGIDSFAAAMSGEDPARDPAQRMHDLIEVMVEADRLGLDTFGIGEHHRKGFLDSAPAIILAAAAARTRQIRLTSAVAVLSAIDPVRLFQQFATLDLVSDGRAEMVVGRGSFVEAFPLFGHPLELYDELFAENLDLLLTVRDNEHVTWTGKHRPPLTGQGVYPRPKQARMPIWLGAGGSPGSFARAGALGLPLMVAIIGGETRRFRPLIDLYRHTGREYGHPPEQLKVGIHSPGLVAGTTKEAADAFFPGVAAAYATVGKERGWPPYTRAQLERDLGPTSAQLIGTPEDVVEKMIRHSKDLGGVDRWTFQLDMAHLPHGSLLGTLGHIAREVAPALRERQAEMKPQP